MASRCYLGIDGGGTNTRALLADETGQTLGTGLLGSANRNHHSHELARQNLRDAIRSALSGLPAGTRPSAIFCGMSGVSTDDDRQEVLDMVAEIPEAGSQARVVVENDTLAGLTGGLAGRPGLALIAGTGSACLGVNERGERWLCGGWGAIADDAGSAPWVGLRALQMAARAEDGRTGPTALQKIVLDYLGLTDPRRIIHRLHNQGFERAEMGGLAPLVVAASQNGDAAAEAILQETVAELSGLAATAARRLFGEAPCEMILVGGLARSGPPFQPMLTERLRSVAPNLRIVEPEFTPVEGAVLEALRIDDIPWTKALLANLAASDAR